MFSLPENLKPFLLETGWRDEQQFDTICKFRLCDKGSTIITINL